MERPSPAACPEPSRLLVRGVNWLGDSVMTTPALQRLRQRFPCAQITILAHEKLADLWQSHPDVDAVLAFKPAETPWSVARRLRALGFDAALILPNSPRSALEPWLAGIPRRIGYRSRWRSWLLTWRVEVPPDRPRQRQRSNREIKRLIQERNKPGPGLEPGHYLHQVHDYLALASALGADPTPIPPRLEVKAEESYRALASLGELLSAQRAVKSGQHLVWMGLNASAAYGPAKCWPLERFAKAACEISARIPNCIWLSFGSSTDRELGEQLVKLSAGPVLNLAGKTSLRQLMALLKECRVLLTNDSGPMHVAAALGTPVVVPFGSTSPELTGPGLPGDRHHHLLRTSVPCAPCFRRVCPIDFRCMTSITVEQVVAAIVEVLDAGGAA